MFKKFIFGGMATAMIAFLAVALSVDFPPSQPDRVGGVSHADPSDGAREGIKVRGHWVIEVRDPDGTLSHRHEFENALTSSGQQVLARVLAGWGTQEEWMISIGDLGGQSACTSNGEPQCYIFESGSPSYTPGSGVFDTLVNSYTPGGTGFTVFGTAVATETGIITGVATHLGYTDETSSSQMDNFTFSNNFGQIAVEALQSIDVRVEFTFS
jgi:hypothetical protein